MKSLLQIFRVVHHQMSDVCGISTPRDLDTVTRRVEHEGLSFFAITLPLFCKAFESALDKGILEPTSFPFFRKNRDGVLPAFLQGFLRQVFDTNTGRLRDVPNTDAILAIRQLCLLFKKFRAECTPRRVRAAFEQYVLTDLEVEDFESQLAPYVEEAIESAAWVLFSPVLDTLERQVAEDPSTVVPRHGPGVTAEKHVGNIKYESRTWTQRLMTHFSPIQFLVPNLGHCDFDKENLGFSISKPDAEPPVRVVTVPKTLKTPRIIAIEPVHMQYVQQGLMELLVPALESKRMLNALGFTDQGPNQKLARAGSIDGSFATLDLSEASDRVSNLLVKAMFKRWPVLSSMIQSCRSLKADVPGYGIIPIHKFASMGSALCFPVEAMFFLTCLFLGWCEREGDSNLSKHRTCFLEKVRVYGDDIIVPADFAIEAKASLERLNLKVNAAKSFWTGKFRESCGADFYAGDSVKPLYLKCDFPVSLRHVADFESAVAFRNLAYWAGWWKVAAFFDDKLKRIAPLPIARKESAVITRESVFAPVGPLDKHLHRPRVFGVVKRQKLHRYAIDGSSALMKFFLKRGCEPFFNKDHLERDGRPEDAALFLRWALA